MNKGLEFIAMQRSTGCFIGIFIALFSCLAWASIALADVAAPVLKWQKGGCYASWCETGWYSSPAVIDLDGNGTKEVIVVSYSMVILNGEDGSLVDRIDPPGGRSWPGVVVADIDNDLDTEIVSAHGSGYVHVYDHQGGIEWSRIPISSELRGLAVANIDGDASLEILVNGAVGSKVNTWVYEPDGVLRSGWPQLSSSSGYAYGVFGDNSAISDLNGDETAEIVVPSDVHYICAYQPDGTPIAANPLYGDKVWGQVGVWESIDTEIRGWGSCDGTRAESNRVNFASGAATVSDVNNDGSLEIVVTGNMYNCSVGHPPGLYTGVFIFNADRSRFNSSGYNWTSVPVDSGTPLTEDYNVIENCIPNPVVADLDGDGEKEILFASYDGRVHAFWLDKTEHGNWPFSVYNASEGFYRFASEPVVADLDNDGKSEVIFSSWVQKGTNRTGKLHIVDYIGRAIHEIGLPTAFGSHSWNGGLAAPTLANIDDDSDLEIVILSAHSGTLAYDLPGTAGAGIQWPTGRGSYLRNGVAKLTPVLVPSNTSNLAPVNLILLQEDN